MQASERMVIVTFQFIVLAVTFIAMIATYTFCGVKTYERRTSWEAAQRNEQGSELRLQQLHGNEFGYFGYVR